MLFWLIIGPVFLAVILYLMNAKFLKGVVILLQVVFFMWAFQIFLKVRESGVIEEALGGWAQGIGISLYADLVTTALVLLTIFLFTVMLIFNYKKLYMNRLFMFLFMILQGLINGIFLSNDLFSLYVLIEVSTIVVAVLIMFKKDTRSIYDGMIYLLTNIVAMSFFLLGIGFMYKLFGVLDLSLISQEIHKVPRQQLIIPYSLLMTAVGLKSAIMPLFSWLPRAHGTPSAPSSVSAILSGLYVKGGVYLLIRLQDIFNPVLQVESLFLVMGFLTGVIGFILALSQTDIKLILAYHTVSQIGLILFGLSLGNEISYIGSIYHIINHAVFKSALFLTAGMIIDQYGTRDIRKIRGVFKQMPYVSIMAFIAFLGITGAPFFNGSISKYLIGKGAKDTIYQYGLLIINLGTIMSFVKYMTMFFQSKEGLVCHHKVGLKKLPFNQKLALFILASACLIGGIGASYIIEFMFKVPLHISISQFIPKMFTYLIYLVVGVLFYKYCYNKITLFKKVRGIELSFNGIVYSIIMFFTTLIIYLNITGV